MIPTLDGLAGWQQVENCIEALAKNVLIILALDENLLVVVATVAEQVSLYDLWVTQSEFQSS